ncbi:MAG: hypothetical protein ACRDQ7_18400 [Haloechinothrix sp.]
MYARVVKIRPGQRVALKDADGDQLLRAMAELTSFAGAYLFEQVEHGRALAVTLWSTLDAAKTMHEGLASRSGRAPALESDHVFEVIDDVPGSAADSEPGMASALYFEGPLGPVRFAAGQRAFRERILPVVATLPGTVRDLVLWQAEEESILVLSIVTSFEALEAKQHAVRSTELLPGEDPVLLPGPDRVEIYRAGPYVDAADVTAR